MGLTFPQIIMLNHAAWVNHERSERRYKSEKGEGNKADSDPKVLGGKKLSELNTDEMAQYYKGFSAG